MCGLLNFNIPSACNSGDIIIVLLPFCQYISSIYPKLSVKFMTHSHFHNSECVIQSVARSFCKYCH
jgi:hypothetical protein